MEYMHPGYRKAYPIETVLRDLASQEGCDGEPYDLMIAAAENIGNLRAEIERLEKEVERLKGVIDGKGL